MDIIRRCLVIDLLIIIPGVILLFWGTDSFDIGLGIFLVVAGIYR